MEIVQDMYRDKLCVIVENSKEKDDLCKMTGMSAAGDEVYPGVIVPIKEDKEGKYALYCRSTYDQTRSFHIGGVPKSFVPISLPVFMSWMEN